MQHFPGSMVREMISSLGIASGLKKAFIWSKKNWKVVSAVVITALVFLLTQKGPSLRTVLSRVREDYEKEIDAINGSHEKEIEARDKANKRYADSLAEVEKKYAEEKKTLDRKKKKEIKKIISESADDPDEITRRIAEVTGFDIHIS